MEEQLSEELQKACSDKKELKKELDQLHQELETLKQTLPTFSRKNWMKAALSKMIIWGLQKQNQKLLKSAAQWGQKILDTTQNG